MDAATAAEGVMLTIGCEAAGRHCMPMDILGAMNKSPRSLMLVAAACALLVLTACGNNNVIILIKFILFLLNKIIHGMARGHSR